MCTLYAIELVTQGEFKIWPHSVAKVKHWYQIPHGIKFYNLCSADTCKHLIQFFFAWAARF